MVSWHVGSGQLVSKIDRKSKPTANEMGRLPPPANLIRFFFIDPTLAHLDVSNQKFPKLRPCEDSEEPATPDYLLSLTWHAVRRRKIPKLAIGKQCH